MKAFMLVLMIAANDGKIAEIPVELWTFDAESRCEQSADYLNKGKGQVKYTCKEVAKDVKVASAQTGPQPK